MAAPFSLGDYVYAHRGLWSPSGPPENSMAAFMAAARAGLGLEFDVRLSADGVPVCFHDLDLKRMTGLEGRVTDCTADMLAETELASSNETIPALSALLAAWPHYLPLLVEIKAMDTPPEPVAEAVATALLQYSGRAAAMSFNPAAVAILPKTLPRGLLVERIDKSGEAAFDAQMKKSLGLQVDFLSVWHADAARAATFARRHGLGLVVWTVRTTAESAAVRAHADAQIIEGFDPALVRTG